MPLRQVLLLLASLAGAAGTAALGFWQLDRAAQRTAAQAQLEARSRLPALSPAELARTPQEVPAQAQRAVRLSGVWLADRSVALDNRPMDGRAGFYLVTPLQLAPGDVVLVQRGWLPRDAADRMRLAPHRTPAGPVTVEGRIAPGFSRLYAFDESASGPIRQNLDLDAFARETGLPLRPFVVVQADTDVDDGLRRQWPAPASGADKNRGYALQWFGLCALISGLYVWFQLVRPRLARRG
jgi:surfeit locus 1 family protein